jgi:hypothetical protein
MKPNDPNPPSRQARRQKERKAAARQKLPRPSAGEILVHLSSFDRQVIDAMAKGRGHKPEAVAGLLLAVGIKADLQKGFELWRDDPDAPGKS